MCFTANPAELCEASISQSAANADEVALRSAIVMSVVFMGRILGPLRRMHKLLCLGRCIALLEQCIPDCLILESGFDPYQPRLFRSMASCSTRPPSKQMAELSPQQLTTSLAERLSTERELPVSTLARLRRTAATAFGSGKLVVLRQS